MVRSYNCLKRAGYYSVYELMDGIDGMEDLYRIRNCGKTSASEIMEKLFEFQYNDFAPERREKYRRRIIEMNS